MSVALLRALSLWQTAFGERAPEMLVRSIWPQGWGALPAQARFELAATGDAIDVFIGDEEQPSYAAFAPEWHAEPEKSVYLVDLAKLREMPALKLEGLVESDPGTFFEDYVNYRFIPRLTMCFPERFLPDGL